MSVDQSNGGINSSLGLQQEFTPTLSSMDSAAFSIAQSVTGPVNGNPGTIALNIHSGGAHGPVIAASLPVFLPPRFAGTLTFNFSPSVNLIPGQLYAMEPFALTQGAGWIFDLATIAPDYVGGRLFAGGQATDLDLVFLQGIGVPEPSPALLIALGAGIATTALARNTGPGKRDSQRQSK
jgi:hypothetical protein